MDWSANTTSMEELEREDHGGLEPMAHVSLPEASPVLFTDADIRRLIWAVSGMSMFLMICSNS